MAYDAVIERQVGKELIPVYNPQATEEQRSDNGWRYRLVLGLRNAVTYPRSYVSRLDCGSLAWLVQKNFELQQLLERELAERQASFWKGINGEVVQLADLAAAARARGAMAESRAAALRANWTISAE